jgi:hypothetical protein
MPIDRLFGEGDSADGAFERALLDSAKDDAVSEVATREAWERFARATGAVAVVGGSAAVLRARRGVAAKLSHGAALKWLVIGAIGGSALTALWTRGIGTAEQSSHSSAESGRKSEKFVPPAAVTIPSRQPELRAPVSTASTALSGLEETTGAVALSRDGPGASPRHAPAGANRRPPSSAGQGASPPDSTLPAEVRALDAVRFSIANGAFGEAARLVDEYHRDFVHGQLKADADVLAIESLEAMGNHADAARRATEFLRRYPKDPHAGRIGAIAGR